jgi:hypothetical protein
MLSTTQAASSHFNLSHIRIRIREIRQLQSEIDLLPFRMFIRFMSLNNAKVLVIVSLHKFATGTRSGFVIFTSGISDLGASTWAVAATSWCGVVEGGKEGQSEAGKRGIR